jgi:hypothetical protein
VSLHIRNPGFSVSAILTLALAVVAEVLQQIDIPVSANTVARLLYQMHFSLRVNRKQIATNSSPLPRSAVPAYLLAADPLPTTRPSHH